MMKMLKTTKSPAVILAVALTCFWAFGALRADAANVTLTQEAQAAITPAKALEMLKQGNERFVAGKMKKLDLLAQVKQTSKSQFPFAAIVSCLDSRIPPALVFDQGIGDIFVARVAGNFVNDDILGSLEFATKLAGAKLIVIMGHTGCGAVEGACDKAQLGLLTATLANINPAVNAVQGDYTPRTSKNDKFVQAVTEMNVKLTMQKLRDRSIVLREMIDKGEIGLVGAMYDVSTGIVTFYK
jgi:carbonic anhydrase